MVINIPTIQPFTYQASTAFQERVQLANKLNEVIDALNQIGDIEDLQTQIDTINSTITQIQTQIGEQNIEISTLTGQINALISDVNSLTTRVSTAETDIGAIEQDISTIQTDIQEIDSEIKGLQGELISEIELVSSPHGSLQVVITHKDETQTTSPAIDLGLVQEGGITLQTGSTDRSFKLLINLTDGTSWQTNDFIIPEGGGTNVGITSISISQGTTADQIRFNVGLSDGSSIESNDWNVVTPTEFAALQSTVSGNSSQISNLNGRVTALEDAPTFALSPATATQLGGVKIGANVTVQADGTISVNLSSYALKSEIPDVSQFVTETELIQDLADYMTAEDVAAAYQPKGSYLTEVPIGGSAIGGVKNGGNVTIETDGTMNTEIGDGWETLDLSNLPTDFKNEDLLEIEFGITTSTPAVTSWADPPNGITIKSAPNKPSIISTRISNQTIDPSILVSMGTYSHTIVLIRLFQVSSYNSFNSSSTTTLFTLIAYVFNGAGMSLSQAYNVNRTNITSYVNKLRRKRTTQ